MKVGGACLAPPPPGNGQGHHEDADGRGFGRHHHRLPRNRPDGHEVGNDGDEDDWNRQGGIVNARHREDEDAPRVPAVGAHAVHDLRSGPAQAGRRLRDVGRPVYARFGKVNRLGSTGGTGVLGVSEEPEAAWALAKAGRLQAPRTLAAELPSGGRPNVDRAWKTRVGGSMSGECGSVRRGACPRASTAGRGPHRREAGLPFSRLPWDLGAG